MALSRFEAAWCPYYKDTIENLFESDRYVSRATLEQQKTEDKEIWDPSQQIRAIIYNRYDEIEIQPVDESIKLREISSHLVASKDVGLVIMGPNIGRACKPSLIILTTATKYFVIYPNDIDHGILFLKNQLHDKQSSVTFWTTNSLKESECLYYNYGIILQQSRAKCCIGNHIRLQRLMAFIPNQTLETFVKLWPLSALKASRRRPRIEYFENLLSIWLEIDKTELHYDPNQLVHLDSRPLNMTAKNLILKRCVLVLEFAKCLDYYSQVELQIMNHNTLNTLRPMKHEKATETIHRILNPRKKCKLKYERTKMRYNDGFSITSMRSTINGDKGLGAIGLAGFSYFSHLNQIGALDNSKLDDDDDDCDDDDD